MTTIIDGTAGITFPVTAGGTSAVQASSSKVLQMVNVTSVTNYTTTSSSFTDTTFNLSITPSSSTSKILIIANLCGTYSSSSGNGGQITLYRNNTTNLGAGGNTFACLGFIQANGINGIYGTTDMVYLDSPATTSSTKYSIYFAIAGGATVGINAVGTSTITLMEIAA